jgi:hypothetical protein
MRNYWYCTMYRDVAITVKLGAAHAAFNEIEYNTAGGEVAVENGELRLPASATVILKRLG